MSEGAIIPPSKDESVGVLVQSLSVPVSQIGGVNVVSSVEGKGTGNTDATKVSIGEKNLASLTISGVTRASQSLEAVCGRDVTVVIFLKLLPEVSEVLVAHGLVRGDIVGQIFVVEIVLSVVRVLLLVSGRPNIRQAHKGAKESETVILDFFFHESQDDEDITGVLVLETSFAIDEGDLAVTEV